MKKGATGLTFNQFKNRKVCDREVRFPLLADKSAVTLSPDQMEKKKD